MNRTSVIAARNTGFIRVITAMFCLLSGHRCPGDDVDGRRPITLVRLHPRQPRRDRHKERMNHSNILGIAVHVGCFEDGGDDLLSPSLFMTTSAGFRRHVMLLTAVVENRVFNRSYCRWRAHYIVS